MTELTFHPIASIFPMMDEAEQRALADDIKENGQREMIVVKDGQIVDGRNRYRACQLVGREPLTLPWEGADHELLPYVISLNLRRRHLNESQRAMVAAKIANLGHGGKRGPQAANLPLEPEIVSVTQAAAAKMLNVSERTVREAVAVKQGGATELVDVVEAGKVSVRTAAEVAALSKDDQREIVAHGVAAIKAAAKRHRAVSNDARRAKRDAKLTALSNRNAPLPKDRRYPIILADPPVKYDFSASDSRSVERHYPTMELDAICKLDIASICTADAMLFLWVPPAFIKKGIVIMEAWGFELSSAAVWVKDKIGTGIYFRMQHEHLLLGRKATGKPITPAPGAQSSSVIEAPRGAHSEKPACVYEIIERMYPDLPKIELFARAARPGWSVWGNQSE